MNPILRLYSHQRALSPSLRIRLGRNSCRSIHFGATLPPSASPTKPSFPPSKHSVTQFHVGVSTAFRHLAPRPGQGRTDDQDFEFSTRSRCHCESHLPRCQWNAFVLKLRGDTYDENKEDSICHQLSSKLYLCSVGSSKQIVGDSSFPRMASKGGSRQAGNLASAAPWNLQLQQSVSRFAERIRSPAALKELLSCMLALTSIPWSQIRRCHRSSSSLSLHTLTFHFSN